MVEESDFEVVITNPPKTERVSLGWDSNSVGKQLIMYWNKIGYQGWYLGEIISYDEKSKEHTITWLTEDNDPNSEVNLLACKTCREWRFVQEDEDIKKRLKELNGDGK